MSFTAISGQSGSAGSPRNPPNSAGREPPHDLLAEKAVLSAIMLDNTVIHSLVTEVSDQEIMDAKALVDAAGIGAETASCPPVAGVRRLVAEGVIPSDAHVVGVLTGHLLKDPDAAVGYHTGKLDGITSNLANAPSVAPADIVAIRHLLNR